MRTSVLEGLGDGHRLAYVGRLARAAIARGSTVTIVTSAHTREQVLTEWRSHIADIEALVEVVLPAAQAPFHRSLLGRALRHADVLLIPDGDRWLPALIAERVLHPSRRPTPVRLLVMRPYPPGTDLRARLNYAVKGVMIRVLQHPVFATRIGVLRGAGAPKPPTWADADVVLDPPLSTRDLPDRGTTREKAGLAGSTVVSIMGVVGPRKNPVLVLRAIEHISQTRPGESWVLYLPGEIEAGLREELVSPSPAVQVVIGGRYLDAEGYAAAFAATDVIAVVHDNEGSSGVLAEAAAYGRSAVAGGVETIRRQGAALGAVVPADGSVESLAHAIVDAAAGGGPVLADADAGGVPFDQFFVGDGPDSNAPKRLTAVDPDRILTAYFDRHGGPGSAGLLRAVRHPIRAAGMLWAARSLPVVDAVLGNSPEASLVRAGLLRRSPVMRRVLAGATAVLELPEERGTFAQGSSASKRSLRTKINKATRAGFTWELLNSIDARRAVLVLGDAYERDHPRERYRNPAPENEYLLPLSLWLLARNGAGRPVLFSVTAIDGRWSVLQHFKTLEDTDDARLARYWLSAVLADELVGRGVRYLADLLNPAGLEPGLRLFQRRLGYRYVRVRVRLPWEGCAS